MGTFFHGKNFLYDILDTLECMNLNSEHHIPS